jgi:hypothetical protein
VSPTYDKTDTFSKDLQVLDPADRKRFMSAVREFVNDLGSFDHAFRPGLRVRGVQGADGVFEMTWAPDGRATFQYGEELIAGKPHIIWRRIGTHDIFRRP